MTAMDGSGEAAAAASFCSRARNVYALAVKWAHAFSIA